MPIGRMGATMIDARGIAEVAAIELIRRDQTPGKLPIETVNLVGPNTLTGAGVAAIWSEVLGPRSSMAATIRPASSRAWRPPCEMNGSRMRLLAERYVGDGLIPDRGKVERLIGIIGRPLHSYHGFANASAATARA